MTNRKKVRSVQLAVVGTLSLIAANTTSLGANSSCCEAAARAASNACIYVNNFTCGNGGPLPDNPYNGDGCTAYWTCGI